MVVVFGQSRTYRCQEPTKAALSDDPRSLPLPQPSSSRFRDGFILFSFIFW